VGTVDPVTGGQPGIVAVLECCILPVGHSIRRSALVFISTAVLVMAFGVPCDLGN
jgi:hypothetical protein